MQPCREPALHRLDDVHENQRDTRRPAPVPPRPRLMARRRREIDRHQDSPQDRFASSSDTGPGSAGGVISTGRVVSRSTRSVVDPKNSLRMPVRPCVLMTMRSQERSRATRRISGAGFPTATSYSSAASDGDRGPSVLRREVRDLALAVLRVPTDPGAQIGGLGQQRILDREHDEPRREMARRSPPHSAARPPMRRRNRSGTESMDGRSWLPPVIGAAATMCPARSCQWRETLPETGANFCAGPGKFSHLARTGLPHVANTP